MSNSAPKRSPWFSFPQAGVRLCLLTSAGAKGCNSFWSEPFVWVANWILCVHVHFFSYQSSWAYSHMFLAFVFLVGSGLPEFQTGWKVFYFRSGTFPRLWLLELQWLRKYNFLPALPPTTHKYFFLQFHFFFLSWIQLPVFNLCIGIFVYCL